MNTLQIRVQKTINYLNSERGRKNWSLNVNRGYSFYKNLFAAVQTATQLIKYESIIEVYDVVSFQLAPERRRNWENE